MNNLMIWLRAETKVNEKRTPLTALDCMQLISAGFKVKVEKSMQRSIPDKAYEDAGCEVVSTGSWREAPADAFILGLKELPEDDFPLHHRHIYFAHVYKEQSGWRNVLARFVAGDGALYDLEFLQDENSRRIAAFGHWAGFAGAAVAVKAWLGQQQGIDPALGKLHAYQNQIELVSEIKSSLIAQGNLKPKVLIIGVKGRCGSGAAELITALDLPLTGWDIEETATGGPFKNILEYEIFINTVFVQNPLPPFLTHELFSDQNRNLSIITDVSCDPYGSYNPLPIYNQCSTFDEPVIPIIKGKKPLDLIAIDHLPSLLPNESSEDFSSQLTPYLLQLVDIGSHPVWCGAADIFNQKVNSIKKESV